MGKRNNGLRKPFSFQTVSKQHQRCAWQWWRHPMRSHPSQNHIAPVPFSADTASSSSRELEGCLWSLCKAKPSEMSLAAADGACGGPDAACMAPHSHPLPHSPRKAAGLVCLGWEWVRIGHLSLSPAAEKKNLLWGNERITTQLLMCHSAVLRWGDCRLELNSSALCWGDAIRPQC